MKKQLLTFILSVSFFFLFGQSTNFHPSQFMVSLKPEVELLSSEASLYIVNPGLEELNERWKLEKITYLIRSKPKKAMINRPATDRMLLFSFKEPINIPQAITEYKVTGLFEVIEPNFIGTGSGTGAFTPNDQFFYNRQWGLFNDGTFNNDAVSGADINMEAAWDISTGDPDMIVAILDSGFKLDHPEMNGRFWNNDGEDPNNNQDDDNNGFEDDVLGWDFINNDNDPTDDHGHGTNVGGIMVATGNNNIGYAGIDWNSQVIICKILNANNTGTYAAFADAVYYAVDNGAKVLNMSVGGSGFSSILQTACDYAYDNEVVVVVSMMNTDNDTPFYPAAYSSTIAVGATDPNDERADPFFWDANSGSNYGSHIDLVAPGNYMYGLSHQSNTNYSVFWGGTSQATPIVAGVASLMKGLNPDLTVEEIRTILRNTAEDQKGKPSEDVAGWDQYHGSGRLNARAALEAALETVSTEDEGYNNPFFSINPNPVVQGGTLILQIENSSNPEFNYSIFDVAGRLIDSGLLLENNRTIKAPEMPGVYVLKLEGPQGHYQSKKFVVSQK